MRRLIPATPATAARGQRARLGTVVLGLPPAGPGVPPRRAAIRLHRGGRQSRLAGAIAGSPGLVGVGRALRGSRRGSQRLVRRQVAPVLIVGDAVHFVGAGPRIVVVIRPGPAHPQVRPLNLGDPPPSRPVVTLGLTGSGARAGGEGAGGEGASGEGAFGHSGRRVVVTLRAFRALRALRAVPAGTSLGAARIGGCPAGADGPAPASGPGVPVRAAGRWCTQITGRRGARVGVEVVPCGPAGAPPAAEVRFARAEVAVAAAGTSLTGPWIAGAEVGLRGPGAATAARHLPVGLPRTVGYRTVGRGVAARPVTVRRGVSVGRPAIPGGAGGSAAGGTAVAPALTTGTVTAPARARVVAAGAVALSAVSVSAVALSAVTGRACAQRAGYARVRGGVVPVVAGRSTVTRLHRGVGVVEAGRTPAARHPLVGSRRDQPAAIRAVSAAGGAAGPDVIGDVEIFVIVTAGTAPGWSAGLAKAGHRPDPRGQRWRPA